MEVLSHCVMQDSLPVLIGRRVLLREPREDDAVPLYELVRDREVTRFLAIDPPASPDDTRFFIERCHEYRRQDREYVFVIAEVASDEPMGIIGLRHLDPPMRTAQVGTWVARRHWGRAVNAEAKQLLLDFAFGTLELHRIEARIAVDNHRSRRAFERLGAQREGRLRESFFKDGGYYDQDLFVVLAQEWRIRAAREPGARRRQARGEHR
jgi:[ribosomal protein S5]-alanine N-acetyltransferase